MLGFRADPLEKVRVGFIGLGYRGADAVERFVHIEDASIAALCDIDSQVVEKVVSSLGLSSAKKYSGVDGYRELCEDDDIDLVYIAVPWTLHARFALYAMEQGRHVAIEVPAAMTLEECWALVETSERTRRHCMMLENSIYDNFSLTSLNMTKHGLFGEIVYAEGGYIHPLNPSAEPWRLQYNRDHRGDLYPTHGLGPLALTLGIHRGDRMRTLVSMDTEPFCGRKMAEEYLGAPQYANGDHTTTLIRTERGKVIEIQHNVMNPRPYTRGFRLTGTLGCATQYPVESFYFKDADKSMEGEECAALLSKYRHPITGGGLLERSRGIGHHDGMDFVMDYRLVYCLHRGLPLDMDVYDAAEWSCVIPLSEQSLLSRSSVVDVPDFTRGDWNCLQEVEFNL